MHARYLYFAHERLSPAELSAARLDGHLVELGDGYIPADAVETTGLRGASLRTLLGELLVATHLTAAWVHGAVDDVPHPHTVQRAVPQRIHHVIDNRLVYRDGALEARDAVRVGGVLVTSPARTLADLVRQQVAGDDSIVLRDAVLRLAERPGAVRDAVICLALQDAPRGKPDALRALRRRERETLPRTT